MTEKEEKKAPGSLIWKMAAVTIVTVAISIFYVISAWLLALADMSYRTWVEVPCKIVLVFIMPFMLLLLLSTWIVTRTRLFKILKLVLPLAASAGYLYLAYIGLLIMAFTTYPDSRLTDDLLVANKGFPDSYYVYYEPVGPFLRRSARLTAEHKLEYLEEKYGCNFLVEQENVIYDAEHPDVKVSVYVAGAGTGDMELADDYVERTTEKYLQDACEYLEIEREWTHLGNQKYLVLHGKEDIEAFAEDVSRLICYCMEATDFFQTYRGVLRYECDTGVMLTGSLTFGNADGQNSLPEEDYRYPEQIERILEERFADYEEYLAEMDAMHQEYGDVSGGSGTDIDISQGAGTENETEFNPEEAAQKIYEQMLEEQGYSYEVCYNAKGNLYIDLGSRPAGETEDLRQTGYYRFELVYDRRSKNNACDLFVLYKYHYSEAGTNYGTAIQDTYAVVTETGEVIASGKHAWEDIGSAEYREATGE